MQDRFKKMVEQGSGDMEKIKKSDKQFKPVSWDDAILDSRSATALEGRFDSDSDSDNPRNSATAPQSIGAKKEKVSVYCTLEQRELAQDILRKWRRSNKRKTKISDIWIAGLKLLYEKEFFFDKAKERD
jgi:hypothetical protein